MLFSERLTAVIKENVFAVLADICRQRGGSNSGDFGVARQPTVALRHELQTCLV